MSQPRIVALLLAAVCLLNETGMLAANSDRPHLDSLARAARDANASSRIIVRYRPGAGPRMRTLMASGRKLRSLAADPTVAGISTDVVIRATGAGLSPAFSSLLPSADVQQLRRTLGLGALPLGGRGVGIAVVDSGIAPMPDLAGRITAFYDFTAGGIPTFPSDQYGHGTHVAGLIAGSGALSAGAYPGIAPEGRLIGLKVLDANGAGYTSDVIAAIEFATDHRASLGIDVINLSLGHPVLESAATDPLVQAVERAAAAGIVVVASAGNFGESRDTFRAGFGGISSPGNAPSALTVGAIRTNATVQRADDVVPSFSSRGPTWFDGNIKPDIVAPGVSLIATSHPGSTLALRAKATTGYLSLSGTSMASAVAAGVVALMIEANRLDHGHTRLTPNTVKMLLQYSAVAVGAPSNTAELIEGAGGINAAGAIGLARAIDPSTQVGGHWLEHGITPATRIAGTLLPWTRRVTWGDRLVVGEVVSRKESAWSARGLWGAVLGWSPDTWVTNSTVLASFVEWSSQVVKRNKPVMALGDDHIVWGNVDEEDAVWGSCSAAEGDHIVWGNCGEHIVWGNTVTQGTR